MGQLDAQGRGRHTHRAHRSSELSEHSSGATHTHIVTYHNASTQQRDRHIQRRNVEEQLRILLLDEAQIVLSTLSSAALGIVDEFVEEMDAW